MCDSCWIADDSGALHAFDFNSAFFSACSGVYSAETNAVYSAGSVDACLYFVSESMDGASKQGETFLCV